jgi:ribonuclease HI
LECAQEKGEWASISNCAGIEPPEGKLMINVDASFDSDTGSGSTGIVIRDATGECVAAWCCHLPHVTDAAMALAEAYALRDDLKLAQQIGSNRFIVQADCMMVVETMEGGFRQLRQHQFSTIAIIRGETLWMFQLNIAIGMPIGSLTK